MNKPFTYAQLRDPELACAELGKQSAEWVYLHQVAHLYENHRDYPPDWQWRRYFVKKHARGRCQRCNDTVAIAQGLLRRHDTHHRIRIGERVEGEKIFDHTFGPGGNLQYLCDKCHKDEHQIVEPDMNDREELY